jgi:acyl carrier protein
MTSRAIESLVRGLIADVSKHDVSSLPADDDLVEHLGVDSLMGLQILAAVEKHLDVRLPDEELIHLRSIGRISEAVLRSGGPGSAGSVRPRD